MAAKTIGGLVAAGSLALANQIAIWNGTTTLRATLTQLQALLAVVVETIAGHIETAANKTYVLDQSAAYGYTVNSLTIKSASGTCTARLTIDGTNVTGISAVSVSSTETTATASGANAVAVGQTLALVISSNAAALDVAFSVKTTRA